MVSGHLSYVAFSFPSKCIASIIYTYVCIIFVLYYSNIRNLRYNHYVKRCITCDMKYQINCFHINPILDDNIVHSLTNIYNSAKPHKRISIYNTMECIKLIFIVLGKSFVCIKEPQKHRVFDITITLLPQRAINTRGTHNNQCGNIHY